MPRKSSGRKTTRKRASSTTRKRASSTSTRLSPRTKKAIDTLPSHARQIYTRAHKNALKQYESPAKRRGGKRQSKEQVAHKVAWSAVKKAGYKKEGDRWEKS